MRSSSPDDKNDSWEGYVHEQSLTDREDEKKTKADDDGFESFNGNGSRTSEEESHLDRPQFQEIKRNLLPMSESRVSSDLESEPETKNIRPKKVGVNLTQIGFS